MNSATFSVCGRYRYSLTRPTGGPGGTVLWIMINPSVADGDSDDPTIRKVVGFSQRDLFGRAIVCNLLAVVSTDVAYAMDTLDDGGPANELAIRDAVCVSDAIVYAWGPKRRAYPQARRIHSIVESVRDGRPILCCGVAKDGAPTHPLIRPYAHGLQPYDAGMWR